MSERATWSHYEPIPRVTQAISVERYNQDDIEEEIQRLSGLVGGMGNNGPLADAANAWTAAVDKMNLVQERVRAVGAELAGVWSSEGSEQSQWALMLIYDAAGDLASTAYHVADFTGKSDELMRAFLERAPSAGDPGPMEQAMGSGGWHVGMSGSRGNLGVANVGETVGSAIGHLNDSVGEAILGAFGVERDRTAEYQAALAALNEQYVAESWRMPATISAELPQIDAAAGSDEGIHEYDPIGGPPMGTGPGMGPGMSPGDLSVPGSQMAPGTSPGEPSLSAGEPMPGSGQGVPGIPGSEVDAPGTRTGDEGYNGGLAGTGMTPGSGGAGGLGPGGGVSTGMPGGAGTGGPGPGGAGLGGIGTGPGSLRPGMPVGTVPMGAGAGGSGTGGGRGTGGMGRGAGGMGRHGVGGGMMPMGGAGGRSTGSSAAARPGAPGTGTGRVAGGRPGMAGMMPGGGRGDGEKHSSHDSWLVEEDDPFTADDDVPPGIIR